jgi:glucan biosynthesis protein C
LFYMFVLGPVTEYFFSHSWNSTEPTSFANEWLKHIRNGQFLQENGPLWFCLALLIFSVVYAVSRRPRNAEQITRSKPPGTPALIAFALVMATLEFAIRLVAPGLTVLNMHIGDFAQYILLFAAGIFVARGAWLPRLSFRAGMLWLGIVLPCGFAAWLTMLSKGGALSGNAKSFFGGWHWQSAAFDLWECFTCVAISFGLLVLYREYFNSQGRLSRFLSANAFAVYVFHPPIVIAGARLLHGLVWHPLVKFGVLTAWAAVVSFALSATVFRRIPLLRRIL